MRKIKREYIYTIKHFHCFLVFSPPALFKHKAARIKEKKVLGETKICKAPQSFLTDKTERKSRNERMRAQKTEERENGKKKGEKMVEIKEEKKK